MKWKEFLKPDWRKIVILILLFIIASLEGIGVEEPIARRGPVPTIYYYHLNPLLWVIPPFELISVGPVKGYEFLGIRLDIIPIQYYFSLIYWYILSCLIVWIYDRVKKKWLKKK